MEQSQQSQQLQNNVQKQSSKLDSAPSSTPSPTIQSPSNASSNNGLSPKVFLGAAAVLVVLIGGYFAYRSVGTIPMNKKRKTPQVSRVDLSSATDEFGMLPEGFPWSIPVDSMNITDSYTIDYDARGVTQYSVTYNTDISISEKYKMYKEFMIADGYTLTTDSSDGDVSSLYGTRDDSELSIIIDEVADETRVQITYLEKQLSE